MDRSTNNKNLWKRRNKGETQKQLTFKRYSLTMKKPLINRLRFCNRDFTNVSLDLREATLIFCHGLLRTGSGKVCFIFGTCLQARTMESSDHEDEYSEIYTPGSSTPSWISESTEEESAEEESTEEDSEEDFEEDDTDSYYTDIEEEASDEDYESDMSIHENNCDSCESKWAELTDDSEDDDEEQCLVGITKPYVPGGPPEEPATKYDKVSRTDWIELKALIMMLDAQGIADWFAKKKVSPDDKNKISKFFSPLNHAARVNSPIIFNFLLGEGFPLNTVIHPFLDAALNHKLDIMKKLLEIGADINVTDAAGTTCMHLVARQATCKPMKISYLLAKGANIDQKDNSGMTPLHYALQMGSKGTVFALVKAGADVNAKNGNDRPALHMAVSRGLKITALLYQAGARPGTSETYSEVAAAFKRNSLKVVKFLVKRNAPMKFNKDFHKLALSHNQNQDPKGRKLMSVIIGAGYAPVWDEMFVMKNDKGDLLEERIKIVSGNPRTLQELTCFVVRDVLRKNPTCILKTVSVLPVPEVIKDYLLLKPVFEHVMADEIDREEESQLTW